MTNPTLERVARALIDYFEREGYVAELDNGVFFLEAHASPAALARAAIQALLQVDDSTVEAMRKEWAGAPHRQLFTAALQHILEEG